MGKALTAAFIVAAVFVVTWLVMELVGRRRR
jgi:hypothetical protein